MQTAMSDSKLVGQHQRSDAEGCAGVCCTTALPCHLRPPPHVPQQNGQSESSLTMRHLIFVLRITRISTCSSRREIHL